MVLFQTNLCSVDTSDAASMARWSRYCKTIASKEPSPTGELPAEVAAFCSKEGLTEELGLFVELVGQCFPSIRGPLEVKVVEDPETDDAWVMVDIAVVGEPASVLSQYSDFCSRRRALIPREKRSIVRLSYSIV